MQDNVLHLAISSGRKTRFFYHIYPSPIPFLDPQRVLLGVLCVESDGGQDLVYIAFYLYVGLTRSIAQLGSHSVRRWLWWPN